MTDPREPRDEALLGQTKGRADKIFAAITSLTAYLTLADLERTGEGDPSEA